VSDRDYRSEVPDDLYPGFGSVAPPPSALTFRLVLAVFGLVVCGAGAAAAAVADVLWLAVVLVVLALVALVDIVVIVRRKRRGEPG
jgi:hypothetical protein